MNEAEALLRKISHNYCRDEDAENAAMQRWLADLEDTLAQAEAQILKKPGFSAGRRTRNLRVAHRGGGPRLASFGRSLWSRGRAPVQAQAKAIGAGAKHVLGNLSVFHSFDYPK